ARSRCSPEAQQQYRLRRELQRYDRAVLRGVGFARVGQIDEHPIRAVDRLSAERLGIDRDQALAVLAGGFGEQLLGPGTEIADRGRRHDRHLVVAAARERPQRKTELDAGSFRGRNVAAASTYHASRATEESLYVVAQRCQ